MMPTISDPLAAGLLAALGSPLLLLAANFAIQRYRESHGEKDRRETVREAEMKQIRESLLSEIERSRVDLRLENERLHGRLELCEQTGLDLVRRNAVQESQIRELQDQVATLKRKVGGSEG